MKEFDPPIREEDWGALPFHFLEMIHAAIEVDVKDPSHTFRGVLWIDRHETDDDLFSVVIISNLPPESYQAHTRRLRIPSLVTSRIEREYVGKKYLYRLAIPNLSTRRGS